MTEVATRESIPLNWEVFVTPGIPMVTSNLAPSPTQGMWSPRGRTPDVVKLMRQQVSPELVASFRNVSFPGQIPDQLVIARKLKRNVIELDKEEGN